MIVFRVSLRSRWSIRPPIGLFFVLLVTSSLELLKWMRTHLIPHIEQQNTMLFSRRRPPVKISRMTPIKVLSLAPLKRAILDLSSVVPLLLICVTDVEVRAVLALVPHAMKRVIQSRTYYDLGTFGQTRIYLVQATGMGPTGIRSCLEESICTLVPTAIVLVGIAFGLQSHRQQIGDILLSRQIQDYDPQRWGTGANQEVVIHSRGNRVMATEWLLDRFIAGKYSWPGIASIQTGSMLSGSALIDHREARNRLLQMAPEAIGGEMEAATLCDVAQRHHVDWIVVKAISDWADGTKGQNEQIYQQLAATNAAQFVLHVLRQPSFLPTGSISSTIVPHPKVRRSLIVSRNLDYELV